jgi:hypothetical protein
MIQKWRAVVNTFSNISIKNVLARDGAGQTFMSTSPMAYVRRSRSIPHGVASTRYESNSVRL